MNICAVCHEPSKNVIDDIHLCGHCNLTMQSGSRDSLMQTLELLHRLAKAEAALTREIQKRAADIESLGTIIESQLRILPEVLRARKV